LKGREEGEDFTRRRGGEKGATRRESTSEILSLSSNWLVEKGKSEKRERGGREGGRSAGCPHCFHWLLQAIAPWEGKRKGGKREEIPNTGQFFPCSNSVVSLSRRGGGGGGKNPREKKD